MIETHIDQPPTPVRARDGHPAIDLAIEPIVDLATDSAIDLTTDSAIDRDGSHDFDFVHGNWRIHNRRLRQLFCGSSDWYTFDASAVERPLWGGRANIEEYDALMPSGRVRGLALRLYDPRARQWTIHWSSSTTGTLDRPLVGEFHNGRGEFYGQDLVGDRTVMVRFIWTSDGRDHCSWQQAFSPDSGQSWETNWTMEFTRDS